MIKPSEQEAPEDCPRCNGNWGAHHTCPERPAGEGMSEGELEYFRAQGGSVLVNEIDRLRERERLLVEACKMHLSTCQIRGNGKCATCGKVRAAIGK